MPLSPTGQYTLPNGYLAVTGQDILPSNHNPPLEDIANVLSEAFYRTGVAPMLAQLNMNTFKVNNVANGTAAGDAINLSQLTGFVTTGANSILFELNDKLIQFGATAVVTNGVGQGAVTFGTVFNSVPNTVLAVNGNSAASLSSIIVNSIISGAGFSFQTEPVVVSAPVQVNWIAIGDKT